MYSGNSVLLFRTIAIAATALMLAGCGNSMSRRMPIQMNPAPTAPVASEQLAPPSGMAQQPGESAAISNPAPQPSAQQPSSVATTGAPPAKEDLLGQWTIADSTSSCQLNVSLTGWSGGYRASTRNCTSEELKKIGAWNIEGSNVVLKDQAGQPLAALARTGERRFDGSLAIGGAVAILR